MAPPTTSNRVFGSQNITRVVLMTPEEAVGIPVDGSMPNYTTLVTLKLLLPDAGRLVIPATAAANGLLSDLSQAALRRFADYHRARRQRIGGE